MNKFTVLIILFILASCGKKPRGNPFDSNNLNEKNGYHQQNLLQIYTVRILTHVNETTVLKSQHIYWQAHELFGNDQFTLLLDNQYGIDSSSIEIDYDESITVLETEPASSKWLIPRIDMFFF